MLVHVALAIAHAVWEQLFSTNEDLDNNQNEKAIYKCTPPPKPSYAYGRGTRSLCKGRPQEARQ